jgi:hypothetical protein
LFLVQLENGTTYSAKVVSKETRASAGIEIQPVGQESLIVNKATVVRMTETSESVLKRFSGNLTLGSTYSKGNNAAQYNIGSELDYIQTLGGAKANYSSNLSSSTGTAVSTRNQVDLNAYRLLHSRNYFYGGSPDFLQSSVQGIQRQITVGGGLGRFFKNSDAIRISVFGGLGWQRTSYAPIAQTQRLQELGVALISSNLQVFRFEKTQLNVVASLAPALTQQGRLFAKINASYYVKIFGKFDWNLSFYGNWDTQPPAALASSDYGTTTGFSWTFGNR